MNAIMAASKSLPTSWVTTSRDWNAAHPPQQVAHPPPFVSSLSVKLCPGIDDVQDREIDAHRRVNGHRSAYAVSVSCSFACRQTEFAQHQVRISLPSVRAPMDTSPTVSLFASTCRVSAPWLLTFPRVP
jgi:hypothetical protein